MSWQVLNSSGSIRVQGSPGSVGPTGPTGATGVPGPTGPTSFSPRCSAFNSSGQTGVTTAVALTLNSEDFQTTTGMHSTGSNTSRITVAASGTYLVYGRCSITGPSTGTAIMQLLLYKNGLTGTLLDNAELGAPFAIAGNTQTAWELTNSINVGGGLFVLAANDYLELYGSSTSSAVFGSSSAGFQTRLQVAQVG